MRFDFSHPHLLPYETITKEFEHFLFFRGASASGITDLEAKSGIIELRIYTSRIFDGKIFGFRSFFSRDSDFLILDDRIMRFLNENQFANEMEDIRKGDSDLNRNSEALRVWKRDSVIYSSIQKIKSGNFSLITKTPLSFETYPPLDKVNTFVDTVYKIEF